MQQAASQGSESQRFPSQCPAPLSLRELATSETREYSFAGLRVDLPSVPLWGPLSFRVGTFYILSLKANTVHLNDYLRYNVLSY